jgi:hypothetical protein
MPKFAAFTVGDVIEILHDDVAYPFFVLDAKPEKVKGEFFFLSFFYFCCVECHLHCRALFGYGD